MNTYARMENGIVAELVSTAATIGTLFHPELTWLDVTSIAGIAEGWIYDAAKFAPPSVAPSPPALTLSQLEAQLAVLSAQIAAFSKSS